MRSPRPGVHDPARACAGCLALALLALGCQGAGDPPADAIAPDAIAPDAIAPDAIAPDAIAPDASTDAAPRASVCPGAPGGFVDCTRAAGIDLGRVRDDGLPILSVNAPSVADFDGDGLPDVVTTNFAGILQLWRNHGGFRFEDATAPSGLGGLLATGAATGDLDGDGLPDLVLTVLPGGVFRFEGGRLPATALRVFRSAGGLRFEDRTQAWGFAPTPAMERSVLVGADLADVNMDGRLDVLPHRHIDPRAGVWAWVSGADGTWAEAGAATLGPLAGSTHAFLFHDLDEDGLDDLFALYDATDGSPPRYYRRTATGGRPALEERVLQGGLFGEAATATTYFSAAAGDYDHDGRLDVFVSNHGPQRLLRADGRGGVEDRAAAAGVALPRLPDGNATVGYGVAFADHDSDGWVDLVLATSSTGDARVASRAFLLRNQGDGTFADASPLLRQTAPRSQQSLVASDLDRDGRVDLWFGGASEPPQVLRNEVAGGASVAVRLRGRVSNPDGVGARVVVTAAGQRQVFEMYPGGQRYGSSEGRLVVGLGASGRPAQIEVRWPSGHLQRVVPGDAPEVRIEEPALVTLERAVLAPGEPVGALLAPRTPEGAVPSPPPAVEARLEPGAIALPVQPAGAGRWRATGTPPGPGRYELVVLFDGVPLRVHPQLLVR